MSVLKKHKFADEEVPSNYGYLSGYTTPNSLTEQMRILKELFPKELEIVTYDESIAGKSVPNGAEGYFLIPDKSLFGTTYHEACTKVLVVLVKVYNGAFTNYIIIDTTHLRESQNKIAGFAKLSEQQNGHNVLMIAGQFGIRHRGKSVRRALEVMTDYEFGLGIFEIAIMLLTHQNRLKQYNDLWIGCAGDEYSDGSFGFDLSPCFEFIVDKLLLYANWQSNAFENYGSASVFFSQE